MSLILLRPYSSDKDRNNYSTYNGATKRLFTLKKKVLLLVHLLVPVPRLWPGVHKALK